MSPIENLEFGADDFVDTSGYMDAELEPMDEDTEVKKEQMSDDDYQPDDNDYVPDYEDEKKPHSCQHCNKSFRKKTNLYGHIKKAHDDERPYPCSQCTKAFKKKQALNKHIQGKQISHLHFTTLGQST